MDHFSKDKSENSKATQPVAVSRRSPVLERGGFLFSTTTNKLEMLMQPSQDADLLLSGKLKWFDKDRGFGFVVLDSNTERDVFLHHSVVRKCEIRTSRLVDGISVRCKIAHNEKGLVVDALALA